MPTIVLSNNTGSDFSGTSDVGIWSGIPSSSNTNSYGFITTTKFNSNDNEHALLRFTGLAAALASIPAGNLITGATIELYLEAAGGAGPHTITARRLLVDWADTEATYNERLAGAPWATPGALGAADRVEAASATASVGATTGAYYVFAGPGLVADLQAIRATTASNFGWHFERTDGSSDETFRTWGDSEGPDGTRPRLIITHEPSGLSTQRLTPTSVVTGAGWQSSSGSIPSALDEVTASDADYASTTTASPLELAFTPADEPGQGARTLRYRIRIPSGKAMSVSLRQGATEIAAWQHGEVVSNTGSLPAKSIGGNFTKRNYWQPLMFADLINGSTAFALPEDNNWADLAPRDANGWPTAAFKVIIWVDAGSFGTSPPPAGTYRGIYTDTSGTVTVTAVGSATVSSFVRTGNTCTFDIVDPGAGFLGLEFTGGVTDLKLVMPGYSRTNPPVLNNEAVDHFKQFSILRLMDHMGINTSDGASASIETTWALRKTGCNVGIYPTWELMFQMGQQLRNAPGSRFRGFWVCFQKNVTVDYYQGFANLWQAQMPADCVLYCEDLNELWNTGTYTVSQQILAEASAITTGNIATWVNPRWGTPPDNFDKWYRHIGQRCATMAQAVLGQFPPGSFGTRVRPVLGAFTLGINRTLETLEYLAQFVGTPANYIYALAPAPYTQDDLMHTDTPAAIVQGLRTTYENSVTGYVAECVAYRTLATTFNIVEVAAYEWGPHTHIQDNAANKRLAHLLPEMGLHNQELGQMMWDAGWGTICYYNVGVEAYSSTDVNTLWSVAQGWNANEPKLNALKTLIATQGSVGGGADWQTYQQTLTAPQADAITDYSNLRLRFDPQE